MREDMPGGVGQNSTTTLITDQLNSQIGNPNTARKRLAAADPAT